ncbi:hypothetical protein FS837_005100 [Tulasnella sp. UAMH 9824]|nr:hypothetical protein FS837_005100 [Tulasnella sp. UAMH 9824]
MVHSLLRSLFLYSALVTSAVLAVPAHLREGKPLPRDVAPRDYLYSPYPLAPGLAPTLPAAIEKGVRKRGDVPKKVTNAMRLANGLPPLAPRKLYEGSRAGSALKARTSQAPVPVPAILVYGPNGRSGNPLGFLSKGFNGRKTYYFTTDCNQAMANAQFNAGDLTNPAQPNGFLYVGLVPNGSSTFGSSSPNIGFLIGTAATPSGSPPVPSGSNSIAPGFPVDIESNVWSLGADDELLLTWINPNGAAVPMEIAYRLDMSNSITVAGSLSAFRSSSGYTESTLPTIRLFQGQDTCGP